MPAKKYATDDELRAARKAQRRAWYEKNKALERQRADERRRTRPEVRQAERTQSRVYDEAHREERRLKAATRRANHPETARAASQKWRLNPTNAAKARERTRQWKQEHPGAQRMYQAKRQGIVVEGDLTVQEWREIVEFFDHCCAYCGERKKLEQEHMTPLSRGGQHTRGNVVPACRSCNARKGMMTYDEFLAREGV